MNSTVFIFNFLLFTFKFLMGLAILMGVSYAFA
jgi:hypothetical protein